MPKVGLLVSLVKFEVVQNNYEFLSLNFELLAALGCFNYRCKYSKFIIQH